MAIDIIILMTFIKLFYDIGMCTFQDTYISGGYEKYLGYGLETEDECANLVRTKIPTAAGAIYKPKAKSCVAAYGNVKFKTSPSTFARSCSLTSMSFLYVSISFKNDFYYMKCKM